MSVQGGATPRSCSFHVDGFNILEFFFVLNNEQVIRLAVQW